MEGITYANGNPLECQCEHIIHDSTVFVYEDGLTASRSCPNIATTRVSPSWAICDTCETTMGVYDPASPGYLSCITDGPYAGQTWHVKPVAAPA